MISASRKAISSVHPMLLMLNRTHRSVASRWVSASCQCRARRKEASGEGGEGGPIPFSSSKAASWSMTKNVVLPQRDVPRYQALSVGLSVSVFLLYFLFLREENDLDVELNTSLFDRVPQLEEHQLKVALEHSRNQNQDTKDLEDRLAQLKQNKQRAS